MAIEVLNHLTETFSYWQALTPLIPGILGAVILRLRHPINADQVETLRDGRSWPDNNSFSEAQVSEDGLIVTIPSGGEAVIYPDGGPVITVADYRPRGDKRGANIFYGSPRQPQSRLFLHGDKYCDSVLEAEYLDPTAVNQEDPFLE